MSIGINFRRHQTSIIEGDVEIGNNCFLGHFSIIRPNVKIGNNTEIRSHCFIASNSIIGNNVKIMQFSNICRDSIIEDKVFIGMGTILTNTKNISHCRNFDCISNPPIIKYGARIGVRVVICPGIVIGENSVIGAGSVVTKNVLSGKIYVGNPAREICEVNSMECI